MNEANLKAAAIGAAIVWWWMHTRKCTCPDAPKPVAAAATPTPTVVAPATPAAPLKPTRPLYASPICPAGYDPSEGGSCAKNDVLMIPGYPAPIAQVVFAPSTCPDGYAKEASSGGCRSIGA